MAEQKKRILYLDILRSMAMLAVLVDHFRDLFTHVQILGSLSYFSASMFIFVSGVTSYYFMPCYGNLILRWGL